jgi:hypothetical protein
MASVPKKGLKGKAAGHPFKVRQFREYCPGEMSEIKGFFPLDHGSDRGAFYFFSFTQASLRLRGRLKRKRP